MEREVMHTVTFVGEFFVLTTCVFAQNEDQAIENAIANLENTHGFNVRDEAQEIKVERDEA